MGVGTPSKGKTKRRPLTDEQREHKREIDRAKHRSNRAVQKSRLGVIETDVASLRESIGELVSKVRLVVESKDPSALGVGSEGESAAARERGGIDDAPKTDAQTQPSLQLRAWLPAPTATAGSIGRSPVCLTRIP